MAIYDYTVKNRAGDDVPMANFKGKVLLIVNTATGCGFTPQYKGLEELWQKYHERGLEILDFPCDQFGHQAPGDDDEIHEFCQMRYKTSFDNFKKIEVNGEN
ncbi:glutathione peroxidase, partial [Treponema saccharophilum]